MSDKAGHLETGGGGERVPVAPRARALGGGEALPLVYHVEALLRAKQRQVINVVGPAGAGKSMALRHLREVFGREVTCIDDGLPESPLPKDGHVVIAGEASGGDNLFSARAVGRG
ncbi:MAG: hypothetical protein ACTHN5_04770 [Phycisphaerae bacterium]